MKTRERLLFMALGGLLVFAGMVLSCVIEAIRGISD
jgi:hypothetical protein